MIIIIIANVTNSNSINSRTIAKQYYHYKLFI